MRNVMRILIVTEHDNALGPMVAAFLRDYSTRLEVDSAGRRAAQNIHPLLVESMKEYLIDLEAYVPKRLSDVDGKLFDLVVEWPEMPLSDDLDSFRMIRDRVKNESFLYYRDVIRQSL